MLRYNGNVCLYNATFGCWILPCHGHLCTVSVLSFTASYQAAENSNNTAAHPPPRLKSSCLSLLLYTSCYRTSALRRRLGWGLKDWIKMSIHQQINTGKNLQLGKRNKLILRQKTKNCFQERNQAMPKSVQPVKKKKKKYGTLLRLLWKCSFFSSQVLHVSYGSRIPCCFSNLTVW